MRQQGSDSLKALIRGAGDLATGVALCLHHAGFRIVMTELPAPTAIRRTVAFAEAVFLGSQTVEGVTAERVTAERVTAQRVTAQRVTAERAVEAFDRGRIAVVVDPQAEIRERFRPDVAVDAILKKRNLGTSRDFAPIVIGLGPGFAAGVDVDAVIETMRGHDLGRIRFAGSAAPDTGMPGDIDGRTTERILRAPAAGVVTLSKSIGDLVRPGETVMKVGDVPVAARIGGCLRGLIHEGILATEGMKIGDIDPRGESGYCATVSDKARALGRAVLEAVLIIGREKGLLQIVRGD